MNQLVLSLFPGIGLLDMAFEEEGFCVVRGPDLLWGGDIRRFHPPAGKFDGVIGGPPCQQFSVLSRLYRTTAKHGNLIPEFERCVREAAPGWFLMENVSDAPVPHIEGYVIGSQVVGDDEVGGATVRRRRFTYGDCSEREPWVVETLALHSFAPRRAVTGNARVATATQRMASRRRGGGVLPGTGKLARLSDMLHDQGLPRTWMDETPFTERAKRQMIGNGVPLPMGRAVARAVKRALGLSVGAETAPQ